MMSVEAVIFVSPPVLLRNKEPRTLVILIGADVPYVLISIPAEPSLLLSVASPVEGM